jgi:hypothetical protein
MQIWTHKTHKSHHDANLGEVTTFPFIIFFVLGHRTNTQMSFCLRLPSRSPEILENGIFMTLEAHNIMCRPLIEMRS